MFTSKMADRNMEVSWWSFEILEIMQGNARPKLLHSSNPTTSATYLFSLMQRRNGPSSIATRFSRDEIHFKSCSIPDSEATGSIVLQD